MSGYDPRGADDWDMDPYAPGGVEWVGRRPPTRDARGAWRRGDDGPDDVRRPDDFEPWTDPHSNEPAAS